VIGRRAGRSCGKPLASKPSSTCGAPIAGSMSGTGASSDSLFCSTSCSAATDVITFTIEATRNTVSRVMAGTSPSRRLPKIPS
jgi:hypothetical protein